MLKYNKLLSSDLKVLMQSKLLLLCFKTECMCQDWYNSLELQQLSYLKVTWVISNSSVLILLKHVKLMLLLCDLSIVIKNNFVQSKLYWTTFPLPHTHRYLSVLSNHGSMQTIQWRIVEVALEGMGQLDTVDWKGHVGQYL